MPADPNAVPAPDDRLDSWKEIASYLKKGVRTVQRWERDEGLPVRRRGQDRTGSVFAYKAELDAWWQQQSRRLESQTESSAPKESSTHSIPWRLLTILSLAALAAVAIWKIRPSATASYRPIPLTTDHGWEFQPSFSPDARQIAYVWTPPGGQPSIYIKTIDTGSQVRLTQGNRPEVNPAWSPDGRFIAFLRSIGPKEHTALMLIPSSGGPENKIAEVTAGILSWSPDGQWLVSTDGQPKAGSVVAVSVATGAKHVLAEPYEFGYPFAAISPDSRRLIYSHGGPGPSVVYELALGPGLTPQGRPRPLISNFWARDLLVSPDANEIIYTDGSWEEGVALWRRSLSAGSEPRLIHRSTSRYFSPALSRDGRRLAFAVNGAYRESTWRKPLSDPEAEATPILSSTHSDLNPQYSPDGRYIAFHSTRSGASDIWIADSDGTNPRRLTFTDARTTATPRWSPDGQWIAFESNQPGQSEVYLIRSAGGSVRRLTDNPATDAIPSWSRDGRTIYFCSDRTGRFEIWKMPATGGQPVQVTYGGGFTAIESTDAAYLYFSQSRNSGPVFRMPMAGGKAEQVIPNFRGLFFAVTPAGIYFASNRTIWFRDRISGATREVFTPPKPMGIGLAVSPDGQYLLFTQIEAEGADLYMIDNFH